VHVRTYVAHKFLANLEINLNTDNQIVACMYFTIQNIQCVAFFYEKKLYVMQFCRTKPTKLL
jgi:hypothetical protein